jgi:hypothetical protein
MTKLSLSRAWDETRSVLSRDGRLFASVALAIVVLPQTIVGLLMPVSPGERQGLALILLLAILVFGFIAQIALCRLAIGPSTTVGAAIARGLSRMPALLGAFLLLMVLLFLIMIPLVILMGVMGLVSSTAGAQPPIAAVLIVLVVMLIAYAVFQLAIPAAAAEAGGPMHLLKRSWQLAKGNYLRLLGFVAVMFVGLLVVLMVGQFALGSMIIAALGQPEHLSLSALLISLVAALIQALFTVILATMLTRIYAQLASHGAAQPSVPSSGT